MFLLWRIIYVPSCLWNIVAHVWVVNKLFFLVNFLIVKINFDRIYNTYKLWTKTNLSYCVCMFCFELWSNDQYIKMVYELYLIHWYGQFISLLFNFPVQNQIFPSLIVPLSINYFLSYNFCDASIQFYSY
jgi:hypothetical protein